jgi:hypothetical protein
MSGVLRKGTQCKGDAHYEEAYYGRPAALLGVETLKSHDEGETKIHYSLIVVSECLVVEFGVYTMAHVPITAIADDPSKGALVL